MNMDEKITQALHEAADHIEADERLMIRIKQELSNKKQRERSMMKRKQIKWIAVCAMMLFATTAVYAAGSMYNRTAHTDHRQDFKEPPSVSEMEDAVGYAPKYVESFAAGWTFDSASITENSGTDQEGQELPTWKSLSFNYQNDQFKKGWLALEAGRAENAEGFTGQSVQLAAGETTVPAVFVEQHFKFVPPGYELTEADKAAEASGSLVISYGSSKVEEQINRMLSWQEDGLSYLLLTNCEVSLADLEAMAEEVLAAE